MNRRALLTGLTCLIAAPAIVRVSSLMPIKAVPNWTVIPMRMSIDYAGSMDGTHTLFAIWRDNGAGGRWVDMVKEYKLEQSLNQISKIARQNSGAYGWVSLSPGDHSDAPIHSYLESLRQTEDPSQLPARTV